MIEGGLDGARFAGFPEGCDSFSHPLAVRQSQVRWLENAVTQGAFVQTRPGFKTRLTFDVATAGTEFNLWWVSAGQPVLHPQMLVDFTPSNASPQLIFAVSGTVCPCSLLTVVRVNWASTVDAATL